MTSIQLAASPKSDVSFLQEKFSSEQTIKFWESEWGGKRFASHGSTHSRAVMILFQPRLDVTIDNIITDKSGKIHRNRSNFS
jgi:hypothetical protein